MDQYSIKINKIAEGYPLVLLNIELNLNQDKYQIEPLCYCYEIDQLQKSENQINNIFLRFIQIPYQLYQNIINNDFDVPFFHFLKGNYQPSNTQPYLNYHFWNLKHKYSQSYDELQNYFSIFQNDHPEDHKLLLEINLLQMLQKSLPPLKFKNAYFECESLYLTVQQQSIENQIDMMNHIIKKFEEFEQQFKGINQIMKHLNARMLKYLNMIYRTFKLQERLDYALKTMSEIQQILNANHDSLINSFNDHIVVLDSLIIQIDYQVSAEAYDSNLIKKLIKEIFLLLRITKISDSAFQYKDTVYINNGPFSQWYNMILALSQLIQCDQIDAEWIKQLPDIIMANNCDQNDKWLYYTALSAVYSKLEIYPKAIENCKQAIKLMESDKNDEWLEGVVQLQTLYLQTDEYLLGYKLSLKVEDDVFNRAKNNEVKLFEENQEFFRLALKQQNGV